jgi:FkbM family methyltransferase
MIEFEIREENIDGIEQWIWIKGDDGLWTGPREDWRDHHKQKILKHCKNFRVVVQAGGGCGMYPRLLSNIFDVVYTFEPDEHNFYCLVQNCYDRKITKFNAAVGPTSSLISTYACTDSNRGTSKVEERGNSYIPQMTVDEIKYRYCDLLMLDVEGYELEALKGAMETMHKFNPVVFVECGWRVTDWMKNLGYEAVDNAAVDTIFIRETAETINTT